MSSVRAVPETELMSGALLSADDAWHTVRRYGLRHLLTAGFTRFRYGDGFSHARAFALQLALAAVPLVIAGAGLARALGGESLGEVVALTVVAVSPGNSDALVADVVGAGPDDAGGERAEVVVALGLITAFLAATSAFAQLERGANRIYGTERDRPALRKYGAAALLTAAAGVALAVGLLLLWPALGVEPLPRLRAAVERAVPVLGTADSLAALAVQLHGSDALLAGQWFLPLGWDWVDPVADQRRAALLLGAATVLLLAAALRAWRAPQRVLPPVGAAAAVPFDSPAVAGEVAPLP